MGERALAEIAERLKLVVGIVDPANEGILVGGTAAGLVDVLAHGTVEVEQRILLHARHEDVAR